jgi:CRP-like cAMP-binding protein
MDNPASRPDYTRLLTNSPFAKAGAAALQDILPLARLERYKVPTLLSAAGEQPQQLRLVVEGHIELLARNALGDEFMVGLVSPGNWATWLSCFMDAAPDNAFYSSSNAVFLAFPIARVRDVCASHPAIYPFIIRQIDRRMRLLTEWTGQSLMTAPLQRLAKLLHILAREQQATGNRCTLNHTQARLASLARCSRQTVNEMLQVMAAHGLLEVTYGKVDIQDLARLAAFAEGLTIPPGLPPADSLA